MGLSRAARDALDDAVRAGSVPGGVVAVATARGPRGVHVCGVRREAGLEVTTETRYDLASLTKVIATLPSLLRLVTDGVIALEDRLGRFFSNAGWFQTPSLGDVTLRQLATHTAGLDPWWPLFARVSTRQTALAAVLQARVVGPGSVAYSDVSFMLLGAVVERVTGRRLDEVARDLVFEPLGMTATSFGPLTGVPVAATEDCGWRGRLLEGEVHDENASVWDGVAGHAGVFGTAEDVARYAAAWLRRDERLGDASLLAEAIALQAEGADGVRRGLGWLLSGPRAFTQGLPGYGHTGFTGTSLWIDPIAGVASVLLTNRVHPHRSRGAGIVALRRTLHAAVHEALS
jgi:CubicO group peptidase (beta-lactamase class C family)